MLGWILQWQQEDIILRLVDPQQWQHLVCPDKVGCLQDVHEIPLVLCQAQHIPSPRFRRAAGPVEIRVHQQVAVGLADGVEEIFGGLFVASEPVLSVARVAGKPRR